MFGSSSLVCLWAFLLNFCSSSPLPPNEVSLLKRSVSGPLIGGANFPGTAVHLEDRQRRSQRMELTTSFRPSSHSSREHVVCFRDPYDRKQYPHPSSTIFRLQQLEHSQKRRRITKRCVAKSTCMGVWCFIQHLGTRCDSDCESWSHMTIGRRRWLTPGATIRATDS